jgi:hypothetical protein
VAVYSCDTLSLHEDGSDDLREHADPKVQLPLFQATRIGIRVSGMLMKLQSSVGGGNNAVYDLLQIFHDKERRSSAQH